MNYSELFDLVNLIWESRLTKFNRIIVFPFLKIHILEIFANNDFETTYANNCKQLNLLGINF
jgi:hypothetical protein